MIIGIDPDTEKSGIAIISLNRLSLYNFTLIDLFNFLNINYQSIKMVNIEASWLSSHNWSGRSGSLPAMLKAANRTGANHQIGKEIEKACIEYNIPYRLIRPLKKVWGVDKNGSAKKIDHKRFMAIRRVGQLGFTETRTNQEQRDAALLIL